MNQILASLVILVVLLFSPSKSYCKTDKRFFDNHQKNALWVLSGGKCKICKITLLPHKGNDRSVEYDHVIPYSKGGYTSLDNGQALCRRCNRKKSDKH